MEKKFKLFPLPVHVFGKLIVKCLARSKEHYSTTYRLQKSQVKLRFGGRQSKKSRWNYFESLQDSKATRQEIEHLTSLREGKSCLN